MSKEDYLDDLLNSVDDPIEGAGDDEDAFIRQFEQEMGAEGGTSGDDAAVGEEDDFFDSLDSIVEDAKADVSGASDAAQGSAASGDLDADFGSFGGDDLGADFGLGGDDLLSGGSQEEDPELMNLLNADGDFSGVDDMMGEGGGDAPAADANVQAQPEQPAEPTFVKSEPPEGAEEAAAASDEEEGGKKRKKKKGKKEKAPKEAKAKDDGDGEEKGGLFSKLSKALFGDDEDEEEEGGEDAKADGGADVSDENQQILKELEGAAPADDEKPEEDKKAAKKRAKAEKKAQAAKDKEAKAKAKAEAKAKKDQAKKEKAAKKAEEKAKKPKEKDNTPPLPKVPVILIFVMVGSLLGLILLGTRLVGYSNSMGLAEASYGEGSYADAFAEISGLKLKEEDQPTYEKYRIMAEASQEYDAYQSFMEAQIYDMALDSLVRTVGRCNKYMPDAESYGCVPELEALKSQAVGALGSFGITEERANELYAIGDRTEYSVELHRILEQVGLITEEEE